MCCLADFEITPETPRRDRWPSRGMFAPALRWISATVDVTSAGMTESNSCLASSGEISSAQLTTKNYWSLSKPCKSYFLKEGDVIVNFAERQRVK